MKTFKFQYLVGVIALLCIFSSCNSYKSVGTINRESLYVDDQGNPQPTLFTARTDATQRISVIIADKDGNFKTFSENPPDAAAEAAMSIFAKADVKGKVTAETKAEFAKTIAELGKRSEAISFQRDGMFRISEMLNNGGIEKQEIIPLIETLQSKALEIAKYSAEIEIEKAKVDRIKEINILLDKADPASPKPDISELLELINNN